MKKNNKNNIQLSTKNYSLTPVATYENPDIQKDQISSENQEKAGIYLWRNKINGNIYIGFAVNLPKRISHYYSEKSMETYLKRGKSAIYSAILKHGLSIFKLEILEYCKPFQAVSIEQDYIDLLKPEYNILQIAGSSLGSKRSVETLAKMGAWKRSVETRAKMSVAKKGKKNTAYHPNSQKIEVTDLEINQKTIYPSVREAARALNINKTSIHNSFYRNQQKPYKGRFIFRKL